MKIKFEVETLGYITATFFSEDKKVKVFHSSDYGDGFQELLNQLFFIYDIVINNEQQYYPYAFEMQWRDHFVAFSWNVSMSTRNANLVIKMDELSPANDSHKVELLNIEISFADLFDDIYLSLEDIFNKFGFVGYKKKWEVGNFPVFEYVTLKSKVLGLNLIPAKYDNKEDEWTGKIATEAEANIIQLLYKKE